MAYFLGSMAQFLIISTFLFSDNGDRIVLWGDMDVECQIL